MPKPLLYAQALLFDMDGVLISSIASARRCWRRWAEHYRVPNASEFEIPHGVRAAEIVHMVKPEIDVAEGLRLIEDMEIADVSDVEPLPGARALLERLPPGRWAIVTSATERLLLARLQAAGLPTPERLVSAERVNKGKPNPEPYLAGAKLTGYPPAECIVVEDAPSGVRAGKAAGCRVLGVLGTHGAGDLRGAGADYIVGSLADVNAEVGREGILLRLWSVEP